MTINTKYDTDQWVYLKHDPDQHKRMIVDYNITRSGIQYLLRCGCDESLHYESELRRTKDSTLALNIKNDEE